MAKLILDDLVNLQNETTAISTINANNAAVETAMENTLSRDGTSPNEMLSNLDMNSNRILNLPLPLVAGEPLVFGDESFPSIVVQPNEPSTDLFTGSLWIDSDSAGLDLYQLTGGVWVDTGVNLKGATGEQGLPGNIDEPPLVVNVTGVFAGESDRSQFEVISEDTTQVNFALTTYSDTVGGGTIHTKGARGSIASPSPSLAGDMIGGYGSRAYHSGGAWQISSPASIHFIASENQTATNYGMYLRFLTNPKATNIRQERVIISDNGTLWAHDEATYNAISELQTRPFADCTILGSRAAAASSAGSSLAAVHYGGGGASSPGFRGGGSRGTPGTPTASQANDMLCFMGGHGYGTTGWAAGTKALIGFKAAENWTDAFQGTYITLETTPIGSTTRAERMRITDTGSVYLGADPTRVVLDAEGGTITGGFAATDLSLGVITTGTVTPSFTDSNVQTYQNDGAHTLAPPSSGDGTIVVRIVNGATAGAITTSGFTKVSGDLFTTTVSHGFFCYITKIGAASHLYVQAMQ